MKVYKEISDIKNNVNIWKKDGKSIGLVPTMGFLHEGHASLVKESVKNNDITIVSIFVNPLQFGQNEDLSTYPRDFDKDMKFLKALHVDGIFYPSVEEMYGKNSLTTVKVDIMSSKLCGATRPIHFEGVTTVVLKLFNIIKPTNAYFGLKDFQQVQIIKKMVEDLNVDVNIVPMPIVRENDGLALSSRNIYLDQYEREAALSLNLSLKNAQTLIDKGERNSAKIKLAISELINKEKSANIDYISLIDISSLEDVDTISENTAILLAVVFGKARLIDNLTVRLK